jgi:hypothetical protein
MAPNEEIKGTPLKHAWVLYSDINYLYALKQIEFYVFFPYPPSMALKRTPSPPKALSTVLMLPPWLLMLQPTMTSLWPCAPALKNGLRSRPTSGQTSQDPGPTSNHCSGLRLEQK